jgi:hypothetical protein
VALHDSYYQLAEAKWGGPAALTQQQLRALEKFREVADRPGVAIRTRLAPGDVQLLNNNTQIHMRSAYRDWEVGGRRGRGRGWGAGVGRACLSPLGVAMAARAGPPGWPLEQAKAPLPGRPAPCASC